MKKVFSFLLIVFTIIVLTGCGNNNNKLTIINNYGEEVKITSDELEELSCSNNSKFDKYYKEAKISFDGVVLSVDTDTVECAVMGCASSDVINFEGGIKIALSKGRYDLSELDKGTVLHIESTIAGNSCNSHPSHLVLKNLDNDTIPKN